MDEEISQLRTQSVAEHFSAPEASYRELLAEVWNTPTGLPSVIGQARLERERLRLGLLPERAQELEQAVRAALAEEILLQMPLHLVNNEGLSLISLGSQEIHACQQILRAFRYDAATATTLLGGQFNLFGFDRLRKFVSSAAVWRGKSERLQFEQFLDRVRLISDNLGPASPQDIDADTLSTTSRSRRSRKSPS
jgi:hypothetical protein